MEDTYEFFRKKNPWSRYKDLILDYYLKPYLAKVAMLRKPIVIVDCFAGPGRFGDGELGSPLIIADNLLPFHQRGVSVSLFCIERNPKLFSELQQNTCNLSISLQIRQGCFKDYLAEVAHLAKNYTVFLYVDPFKPTDLYFDDLEVAYNYLESGRSVETLINFMSSNFWRAVHGLKNLITSASGIQKDHPKVIQWNQIAGGSYWQEAAFDDRVSIRDQVENLAIGYADQLHRWFKWVLNYPIRRKYENVFPKYHMIFGSRSNDAVDLMNRAMVKARREFVDAQFVKGMLFENQPEKEVVDPDKIKYLILETSRNIGKQPWNLLRAYATVRHPCMYTDSDFNRVIKKAIQEGSLRSNCPGTRTEEKALVWYPSSGE